MREDACSCESGHGSIPRCARVQHCHGTGTVVKPGRTLNGAVGEIVATCSLPCVKLVYLRETRNHHEVPMQLGYPTRLVS